LGSLFSDFSQGYGSLVAMLGPPYVVATQQIPWDLTPAISRKLLHGVHALGTFSIIAISGARCWAVASRNYGRK